jgi:hypothetical protein
MAVALLTMAVALERHPRPTIIGRPAVTSASRDRTGGQQGAGPDADRVVGAVTCAIVAG